MKSNVGVMDRNIRILIGSILVIAALFAPLAGEWRIALLVMAAVAYGTGFIRL